MGCAYDEIFPPQPCLFRAHRLGCETELFARAPMNTLHTFTQEHG
jgi:hypothetical protein